MLAVRPLCVLALVLLSVSLAACPGDVPPRDEGDDAPVALPDAPIAAHDAPLAVDARTADARAVDAGGADAKVTADAPIACTITGGTMGICIDMTVCMSMPNHTAHAGFCPGPAAIQCCTVN